MDIDRITRVGSIWFIPLLAGGSLLFSGIYRYTQGAPIENWAENIVFGASFLLFCVVMIIGSKLGAEQPTPDRVEPTDWVALTLFGSWVVLGTLLRYVGLASSRTLLFAAMGILGAGIMSYLIYRNR